MGVEHNRLRKTQQRGVFLIEAMVAMLIFALGILGLVAMGGAAVSSQADAQYRTEASNVADAIASLIALKVDRTTNATMQATLMAFDHQSGGANCNFNGPATAASLDVNNLIDQAANAMPGQPGLPGATAANIQIKVNTVAFNRVEITLCWRAPNDTAMRRNTLVTYINRSN